MARTIVITNQKGGVAKTTTAHCMITGLAHLHKYKVLAIDTDPQGSLSYIMGADLNKPGVYELLKDEIIAPRAVQTVEQGSIVSGNLMLSRVNLELKGKDASNRLSEALDPFKSVYDYIVIDTSPTLGMLPISALVAADDVIIPVSADALSMQGLGQLHNTIRSVRQKSNPTLNIAGILLCRYSGRTVLARDMKQTIVDGAKQMGTIVFRTTIRDSVALKETQARKANPYKTFIKPKPANDYLDFINEYLGLERDNG